MSTGCKDIAGLMDAAYAIMVLRDTLERWLHGLPTEDVILGGVPVPTLRKLVATIDERESRAAEDPARLRADERRRYRRLRGHLAAGHGLPCHHSRTGAAF